MNTIETDLCVIGAGSGGLSVAAGAVQMGARVVLIEKGEMGGDCLNYGCVPSKAILAAGKAAKAVKTAADYGVHATTDRIDFAEVNRHVKATIATIAPHDSQERFEDLGCTVIRAAARFVSPTEVEAGDSRIKAKKFIISTGSSPFVPPIPGLDGVEYFTNETIFENTVTLPRLIVIGGGPIGCELAQAHARLGSQVEVFEMASILPKDDPDLVAVVRDSLVSDGIQLHEATKVTAVERNDNGVTVHFEKDGQAGTVDGSHLLVAVGRKANVDSLNLEAASIDYSPRGIDCSAGLETSNKNVYAMGDVANIEDIGAFQFTHVAGYHAGVVIKNALFKLPSKVDYRALPWVSYTEPELANVGMTAAMADKKGLTYKTLTWDMDMNDRAQAENATSGRLKVLVDKKGHILGAGIVGKGAGEMIHGWGVAIQNKLKIGAMTSTIAAYPTLSEASKRVAGSYYTDSLFSDRTRKIVKFLLKF